jgi:hypothetical protein
MGVELEAWAWEWKGKSEGEGCCSELVSRLLCGIFFFFLLAFWTFCFSHLIPLHLRSSIFLDSPTLYYIRSMIAMVALVRVVSVLIQVNLNVLYDHSTCVIIVICLTPDHPG